MDWIDLAEDRGQSRARDHGNETSGLHKMLGNS
jgi:hypothetical protein